MVVLKRQPSETLRAFITGIQLSQATIDQVLADFRRGAYDAYDPSAHLVLDRESFLDASPEEVRDKLDGEGCEEESFLIVDGESEGSRSVLWVDQWAEKAVGKGEWEVWRRNYTRNVESGERVLLKVRMVTADVPLYFISTLEGETDIFDRLPLPYDPHASASQTPSSIYDWQHNPPVPPPIRVVASPEEYESSSAPEDVQNFVIPPDGHPKEVVRLKEEVARAVGLKSGWAVAVPVGEDGVVSGFISNSSGLWRHDNA